MKLTAIILAVAALLNSLPVAEAVTITLTSATAQRGFDPNNPNAEDLEDFTGVEPLTLAYKANVGGQDEGPFAASYTTTFSLTASNPSNALITWDGAPDPFITGDPIYLIAKGPAGGPGAQDPFASWYLWNISGWNGTDALNIVGLWPAQGAISYVAIYTGPGQPPGNNVPEGGSAVLLMALGMGAVATARRWVKT